MNRRNRKIIIERATVTTNDYGEEVPTWATYATVFAQVVFGTGSERREAAQESATAPATFRVLDTALTRAATPKDRISFDGSTWEIVDNVPSIKLNRERDITAVRKVS